MRRITVSVLVVWTVVGVLHALLAAGHYEERIVRVTHGDRGAAGVAG